MNNDYKMLKINPLHILVVLFFVQNPMLSSYAAELIFDKDHKIIENDVASELYWRVNSAEPDTILIYNNEEEKLVADYDISGCMFCSGEDDNCDSDGIFNISAIVDINDPTIGLVCHVGAHSQQLRIFQPAIDQKNAIEIYTGSYYINYEINHNGLIITYDVYQEGGKFQKKTVYWP